MVKRKLHWLKGPKFKARKLHNQQTAAIEETSPPILNLIADCCYGIFDWLSLKDLHSFGQTCKWAQQVAGTYFQSTYSGTQIECRQGYCNRFGIRNLQHCGIDAFSNFFPELSISESSLLPFRVIEANCGRSIKRITLRTHLTPTKIKCLNEVLANVEGVRLENCSITGSFYGKFIKFCKNLRSLCVSSDAGLMMGNGNNWLVRRYPTLEHFGLAMGDVKIDELKMFFEQNLNIRSFETRADFLWANKETFMTSNTTQLDTLTVFVNKTSWQKYLHCTLLNELYDNGFYKQLNIQWDSEFDLEQLLLLRAIQKLNFSNQIGISHHILTFSFAKLTTLYLPNISQEKAEIVARNFVNIEQLNIRSAVFENILPFIRRSTKLKTVKVGYFWGATIKPNFRTWNSERENLSGASKVTIYMDERCFLEVKWTTLTTRYSMIELKRQNTFKWDRDFYY